MKGDPMITVTHPDFEHVVEFIEKDQLAAYVASGWLPPKDAPKAVQNAAVKVAKAVKAATPEDSPAPPAPPTPATK